MEINVTPEARQQLELIQEMDSIKNGFVLGRMMGKHMIVERFFPANFTKKNIDAGYRGAFLKMGEKLVGVFFTNDEPFVSQWFLEDVIFKIKSRHFEYEIYENSADSAREHLQCGNKGKKHERKERYENKQYYDE
jgi:hypothetical protein